MDSPTILPKTYKRMYKQCMYFSMCTATDYSEKLVHAWTAKTDATLNQNSRNRLVPFSGLGEDDQELVGAIFVKCKIRESEKH